MWLFDCRCWAILVRFSKSLFIYEITTDCPDSRRWRGWLMEMTTSVKRLPAWLLLSKMLRHHVPRDKSNTNRAPYALPQIAIRSNKGLVTMINPVLRFNNYINSPITKPQAANSQKSAFLSNVPWFSMLFVGHDKEPYADSRSQEQDNYSSY